MSRLVLEVGQTVIELPLNGTAQQIRAIVRRYAVQAGLPIDGLTDVQVGQAVLRKLARIVRDGSIDRQRLELLAAQQATMESQLATENDIVDEEPPPTP